MIRIESRKYEKHVRQEYAEEEDDKLDYREQKNDQRGKRKAQEEICLCHKQNGV